MQRHIVQVLLFFSILFLGSPTWAAYYISPETAGGSDSHGQGTKISPWATITHALDSVPDNSEILLTPGTYNGRIRIRGNFPSGVTVRSETPYLARLRHTDTVITAYKHSSPVRGIRLEGFDIAHSDSRAGALVVHIDGGGDKSVSHISLVNNILHDSYNNDILKINNATTDIVVAGNMFYNQTGSDEHIDINSVDQVQIHDNIFFNDFRGSGRNNDNNTSSYIVIKDSNGNSDSFTGSRNVSVRRNIFLNWEGSSGSNFILIGEDGNPFFEGFDILIENNLLLGNSSNVMRAPFGVKGGRNITFRNNTISGDLPSMAYGMRLNSEGSNPANDNIQFYNNIWSDQTGTMGAENPSRPNDFSDTPMTETRSFTLDTNLYWNGGAVIPHSNSELINASDDPHAVIANPQLAQPTSLTLPRWSEVDRKFNDNSSTIRQSFLRLVNEYCALSASSPARGKANISQTPLEDIRKSARKRSTRDDLGACTYTSGQQPGGGGSPSSNVMTTPLILLLRDQK